MTRKKVRPPITKQLLHTCSECMGAGLVESYETMARKAVRALWTHAHQGATGVYLIEALPPIAGWVRTIGVPEGIQGYLLQSETVEEGYRISPTDAAQAAKNAIRLK